MTSLCSHNSLHTHTHTHCTLSITLTKSQFTFHPASDTLAIVTVDWSSSTCGMWTFGSESWAHVLSGCTTYVCVPLHVCSVARVFVAGILWHSIMSIYTNLCLFRKQFVTCMYMIFLMLIRFFGVNFLLVWWYSEFPEILGHKISL